ncbi:MAG: exo-alpha-sialidase [Actinobacteria bacterium]|nr:MAG: exo-alpha-sialidase [Actinomycetota bacterium]
MKVARKRARWCIVMAIAVLVLAASSSMPAGARQGSPFRRTGTGRDGIPRFGPAEVSLAEGRAHPLPSAPAAVRTTTVDRTPWTGYENAVYASDDNTVFVAYKRFTEDPSGGGYNPAELRVAKSVDGGVTWTVQVVDPDAIEQGDTIDGSVSIDGDHGSTVYVAYHVRASGLFSDMKLRVAKSTDGGSTWTIHSVADGYAGDYNSIRVLDSNVAVISAHAAGADEGVHTYITRDGGATWTDSLVEGGLGDGIYTSVGAINLTTVFVGWYNSLYPDHTDLNAGRRVRGGWRTMTVDGVPGDNDLTGLGASTWVASGPTVWIAYEADTSQGAFVRVAKFVAGTPGWTIVPVEQGGTIGWNTAVHSVGTSDLYVSYWKVEGTKGEPMLASSSDGGATWSPFAIPDLRYAQPYLDSTSPSVAVQYESYQTTDQLGHNPVLRVARIER